MGEVTSLAKSRKDVSGERHAARAAAKTACPRAVCPSAFSTTRMEGLQVVVIAVSTGEPLALEMLLPQLPANFAAAVLIVQHMPRLFTGPLVERLRRKSRMAVMEAREGDEIGPGQIWLAPGDRPMEFRPGSCEQTPVIHLHTGPALNGCMPSADYLFYSAAKIYGPAALALVMTGMGADGVDGARMVREASGMVLAQDEASSAVWGMPGHVVHGGFAHATVPLNSLAAALVGRIRGVAVAVGPDARGEVKDEVL